MTVNVVNVELPSTAQALPDRQSAVRCPHDQVPMVRCEKHALIALGCHWCRCLWLPATSWRTLCQRAGFAADSADDSEAPPRRSRRACPACSNQQLVARNVRGIEIDLCIHCAGVWLNHGEIQRLLGIPMQPSGKPIRSVVPDSNSSGVTCSIDAVEVAGTGIEVIAEFVGDLVSGLGDAF